MVAKIATAGSFPGCCPLVASGHTIASPPNSVMISRPPMCGLPSGYIP